jgi:hypothetical protein
MWRFIALFGVAPLFELVEERKIPNWGRARCTDQKPDQNKNKLAFSHCCAPGAGLPAPHVRRKRLVEPIPGAFTPTRGGFACASSSRPSPPHNPGGDGRDEGAQAYRAFLFDQRPPKTCLATSKARRNVANSGQAKSVTKTADAKVVPVLRHSFCRRLWHGFCRVQPDDPSVCKDAHRGWLEGGGGGRQSRHGCPQRRPPAKDTIPTEFPQSERRC